MTHVLPTRRDSYSYHQQRNEVLPAFAKLVLNRVPVKRVCEILNIGSQTYYNKLEWLYRRCLEFLERHEIQAFENKTFGSLWINTDKMIYFLNNLRKRGKGGIRYDDVEESKFPTHVIVSGDIDSMYIFRADVAFDWDVTLNTIEKDTLLYKDDHLNEYARKHARLRFQVCPQPPTEQDTESKSEYMAALHEFTRRGKYIDGVHVNSTYTTLAQFWLMKQMIHAKQWRFVSDEDSSIMSALYHVFADEVRKAEAHHFLCKIDRNKSLQDSHREYIRAIEALRLWGTSKGLDHVSLAQLARMQLTELFKKRAFHEEVIINGRTYLKWAKNPINHPLPSLDQGVKYVDCTTELSAYDPEHIANMVLKVSDKATGNFMQAIRRRLSILERPLVTARGDGKSYIYTNSNPKYAQYAITILRTYYNFCLPIYSSNKKKTTPAQQIGITNKKFDLSDIIYFK